MGTITGVGIVADLEMIDACTVMDSIRVHEVVAIDECKGVPQAQSSIQCHRLTPKLFLALSAGHIQARCLKESIGLVIGHVTISTTVVIIAFERLRGLLFRGDSLSELKAYIGLQAL